MPEPDAMTLEEMLAEIAKHPPDDPRHALARAVRDAEADLLKAWMIVGEEDDAPVTYRQMLALGFVEGAHPPKYCLLPGPADGEGQLQVDAIAEALRSERPLRLATAKMQDLASSPIPTLVYAGYGLTEAGAPWMALWHHPDVSLRHAAWLALLAIASDHGRRTGTT